MQHWPRKQPSCGTVFFRQKAPTYFHFDFDVNYILWQLLFFLYIPTFRILGYNRYRLFVHCRTDNQNVTQTSFRMHPLSHKFVDVQLSEFTKPIAKSTHGPRTCIKYRQAATIGEVMNSLFKQMETWHGKSKTVSRASTGFMHVKETRKTWKNIFVMECHGNVMEFYH